MPTFDAAEVVVDLRRRLAATASEAPLTCGSLTPPYFRRPNLIQPVLIATRSGGKSPMGDDGGIGVSGNGLLASPEA